MPGIRRYQDLELRERLAAEYVLGSLQGLARRRFEHLLEQDPALQNCVTAWERRLNPLGEELPPLTPPPSVWKGIRRRIAPPQIPDRGYWENLRFWRTLGMAAAGMVLVMSTLLALIGLSQGSPDYVAVIVNEQAQPIWLIRGSTDTDYIHVKTIKAPEIPPSTACKLWLLWADGTFQPLGILPEGGSTVIATPSQPSRPPYTATVLVSIEPEKGTPSDTPTGPVVFRGSWLSL